MKFNTFESLLNELCGRLYPDTKVYLGFGKSYEDFIKTNTLKDEKLFCSYQGCTPYVTNEDNAVDAFEHHILIYLPTKKNLLDMVFFAQDAIKELPKFTFDDVNVGISDLGGFFETINGVEIFVQTISILL